MTRSSENRWLHRFAVMTAVATFCLIWVGGLVTSHGVGMAVPDWPTTYGYNMFFFPFSKWVGGIFYEHSHRLVASGVGLLTVVLTVWLWLKEERRWLRWLGVVALVAVVLQGVLGGLRVTQMKDVIGVFHATLAQLFFGLVSAIALFTSRWWRQVEHPKMSVYAVSGLRYLFATVTGLILLQLILGAAMRHQHAGLAIPDFPTAYGKLWPAMDAESVARYNQARDEVTATNPITSFQIGLHMTHRITAFLILISVAWVAGAALRRAGGQSVLARFSVGWLALILTQAALGAATVWTNKAADLATLHVAVGALSLVNGVMLALMAGRLAEPRTGHNQRDQRDTDSDGDSPTVRQGDSMKATATPLTATAAVDESPIAVLCNLVKARLTFLVLLTTLVGFYVGVRGATDYWLMLHAVLGTALVACGAAALNQLWEREYDALMRRTADRPLPSGRMQPETVLVFGGVCSMAGLLYLAFAVNLLTSLLGALTLASYIFIYTPLKRVTWLNTAVGAVPGALPPLMGWTAARNELTGEGWALFAILFFWQIPHFLAIAWMYREEYAKAGFVMLPSVDPDGFRTGRQAVSHTLGLLTVSLMPFLFRLTGPVYLFGALALGTVFLVAAVLFSRQLTRPRARQLFFASILYLPLLLGLMVFDKLKH